MPDTFWGQRESTSMFVRPKPGDEEPGTVLICSFLASDWFEPPPHPSLPVQGRIQVKARGYAPCPKCGTSAPHLQGSGVGVADCPACRKFYVYLVEGSGVVLTGGKDEA